MINIEKKIDEWTIRCNGCSKEINANDPYYDIDMSTTIIALCENCRKELKEKL